MEAPALIKPTSLISFEGLKRYSRVEVGLTKGFYRAFRHVTDWTAWLREAFGEWLEVYQGTTLRLQLTNEIEQGETRIYRFDDGEIRIGRSSECDIVLGVRAIGKQHARLAAKQDSYYLEDLGSPIGTYLNGRKLIPGQPEVLTNGDRVLIFPFSFAVEIEARWVRDEHFELSPPSTSLTTREEFDSEIPIDYRQFGVEMCPDMGQLVIAASRPFLEEIVARLTRAPAARIAESDHGIFEFLIVSVLEKVNRELAFPLQLALGKSCVGSPGERGFKVEFCIALRHAAGVFQIFLPERALAGMRRLTPTPAVSAIDGLTWRIFVCAGRLELTLSDASEIAPGDILLFTEDMEALLTPYLLHAALERGWKVQELGGAPFRLEVKEYFERSVWMEDIIPTANYGEHADQSPDTLTRPDLTSLPVRLHIILAQVELSLAELTALTRGSIIELNWVKEDPVQLAANGKVIGSGSLVEIEGKLGVEITNWSGT